MRTPRRRAARACLCLVATTMLACTSTAREETPRPLPKVATEEFVNRKGDYSFRYPPDWNVVRSGTRTKLTTPSADTIVAFGVAPGGAPAHEQFLESFQNSYSDVEVAAAQRQKLSNKYPALLVSGQGTNRRGVRIRFLAITISTATGDYVIDVFTLAESNPDKVLPPVHEIVNSFRPL